MLKKSLAWVLTLAMLLSTVSGLALFTFADGEAVFAYASYVSGQALYKNATQNLYSDNVLSTPMADITKNEGDRYAAFMAHQNNQIGISIPAGAGFSSGITIEVKFWADVDNQTNTRLGMNYTTASGNTDYGSLVMSGANGQEIVTTNTTATKDGAVVEMENSTITKDETTGWNTLTVNVTNADFNAGGQVNLVKWSHDNGDNTGDGWYIESFLVYDTNRGRPTEDDLYIREDTIGYIDFAYEEKELLDYTIDDKASIVEFEGDKVLKIAGGDGFHLTVNALEAKHPAVLAADANVTVMVEAYVVTEDHGTRFCMQTTDKFMFGNTHGDNAANGFEGYPYKPAEWYVMRFDITDNAGTEFKFGSWFVGENAEIYIRKIVVCRTELVSENTYDTAFIDLDNPYVQYNDFQRVESTEYDIKWSVSENATEDTYTVDTVEGKTAVSCASGFLYLNVDDAFTKNGEASIADMSVTVTYLDKGEGNIDLHYNAKSTVDEEGNEVVNNYTNATIATLANSGEWKTATVYLSDVDLRNAQNGQNDMRIGLANAVISAITIQIGADKTALNAQIKMPVNSAAYTAESVADYNTAKAAAQVVADNKYATKADVDAALAELVAKFKALVPSSDPRFDLINGAAWNKDDTMGSIVVKDGWYVWQFAAENNKWIGIGDPDGILSESTSVTYEYEIFFDTTNNNSRCFLTYGDDQSWHGVKEKAPNFDEDGYLINDDNTGTGFAAGGQWGATPAVGEWGTISLTNVHYDPSKTSDVVSGAITALGSWMEEGTLYVRSIKVYDTEDTTKMIALQFKEDVAELIPTPGSDSVVLGEKDGFTTYMIPGEGWLALNIDTASLISQGVVTEGANNVTIEFEYYLDDWSDGTANNNELLMIKHYNPDGNGQNSNKTDVCEHQLSSADLTKRGEWVLAKFALTDAAFGLANGSGDAVLNITYGNGSNIYIRGIKVYETDDEGEMVSEKPGQWGAFMINVDDLVSDHPVYDWNIDDGYGMKVSFSEGEFPTTFAQMGDYNAAIITDDKLYVNVDDEMIPSTQQYIRIDILHQNGCSMYVQYNTVVPEGTDTSAEPNLTYYNFRSSSGNHILVDNEDGTQSNGWSTEEGEWGYSNPLGVVRSVTDEHINWMTTSIYLTDAQFRNSANGSDFRIIVNGGAVIARVDVYAIDASEIPTLGDKTELQAYFDANAALMDQDISDELYDALTATEDFLKFGYRATQEEIDTALATLKAAIEGDGMDGDVDGDGKITSTDARLVLQYYAKKITDKDLDLTVADVDGDGKITSTDARLILQLYAKKIPAFPVNG